MESEPHDALPAEEMSQLLDAWASKDTAARDRLVPIVYTELRRLAHHYMKGERAGHTLQRRPADVARRTRRAVDVPARQRSAATPTQ